MVQILGLTRYVEVVYLTICFHSSPSEHNLYLYSFLFDITFMISNSFNYSYKNISKSILFVAVSFRIKTFAKSFISRYKGMKMFDF